MKIAGWGSNQERYGALLIPLGSRYLVPMKQVQASAILSVVKSSPELFVLVQASQKSNCSKYYIVGFHNPWNSIWLGIQQQVDLLFPIL